MKKPESLRTAKNWKTGKRIKANRPGGSRPFPSKGINRFPKESEGRRAHDGPIDFLNRVESNPYFQETGCERDGLG